MKVVVLGAGVMGASVALHLARAGAAVTLVEQETPGAGTSSRGAGLVSEAMWHPTSLRLVSRSIDLLEEMSRQGEGKGEGEGEGVGHPFRFHRTGSTTLLGAAHLDAARGLARMQAREGVDVRDVAPDDLAGLPRHDGMRVDDAARALHYPRDGWALPRLYSEVAVAEARLRGARVVRGAARLLREGAGVEVGGERFAADAVVVACGVWTRQVLAGADLDAPIQAYRTQALRFSEARADTVPILHDAVQGFYLRPGIPHHLVAGNGTTTTPEDVGKWRMDADAEFVKSTLRRLHHRFPYLPGDAHVEAWAGIDAATPDRLLLAGPHPREPRVWLLAGGNGHGFMRAPAAGEALAARILDRKPTIDLSAFDPARFSDVSMRFEIREGFSLEGPDLK